MPFLELGRETSLRRWYYCSSTGRVGRRQALKHAHIRTKTHSQFIKGRTQKVRPLSFGDAGWSSPVARQAHNLKVVGSNPTPATI